MSNGDTGRNTRTIEVSSVDLISSRSRFFFVFFACLPLSTLPHRKPLAPPIVSVLTGLMPLLFYLSLSRMWELDFAFLARNVSCDSRCGSITAGIGIIDRRGPS